MIKTLFFSIIVVFAAVSVGIFAFNSGESEVEAVVQEQIIQTIGATMEDIPLESYMDVADYAIVGTVIKTTPVIYVDQDRADQKTKDSKNRIITIEKEILTDVTINVEEDLFKKYDKQTITVRVPGGEIPSQKTIHSASPEFKVGERVIVFVGNGNSYDIPSNSFTVLGLEQGTIKLDDKVKSKYADDQTTEIEIKNKIKFLKNKN